MRALRSILPLALVLVSASGWAATSVKAQAQAGVCDQVSSLETFLDSLRAECGSGGVHAKPVICRAYGYAGTSIDSAIKMCASAGYSTTDCAQHVACEGDISICRAYGYAGTSIDSAIKMCASAGYSTTDCAQHVVCQ